MTLTVNASTTITMDEIAASGSAIVYGADNVTLTIDTGVAVLSKFDTGIFSFNANSSLVNVGNIASLAGTAVSGVHFNGANAFIQNEAGHNITGAGFGVTLDGTAGVFNNYGTTIGLTQAGFLFSADAVSSSVSNFGEIYGRDEGVWAAAGGGNTITNSGTIRSDFNGIKVTAGTLATFIINSGKISGGDKAISVEGTAAVELTNTGTLDGAFSAALSTGNDTIQNRGTINGVVALGDGNDTFNGTGGKSGAVFGGTGNDTLIGGKGGDILWGHQDSDIFKFVKVSEIGKSAATRDQIMDFSDVEGDQIDLVDIDSKKGPGNQDFHFIGAQKFHHKAGELHVLNKGAFFLVEGDINGDGKADFQIEVHSSAPLDKGDFLGVF
jgi:hypothetical protein